jgi:hypothetical protein
VGVGYFFVWTVFGMAAFPLGVALAAPKISVAEMIQHGLNTMKQTLESNPAGG